MSNRGRKRESSCCGKFISRVLSSETRHELSAILSLTLPVGVLSMFQFLLQFITVLFCGHLGDDVLAGVSLAASFVNVSAVVLGSGLGTAIDTLASQSFGANNKRRVGVIVQQSVLMFTAACFPIWGLWLNTKKLSDYIVSNKSSAEVAGEFMDLFLPALPAIFLFIILSKYLENQQIVRPLVITGTLSSLMGIVYNAVLVYGVGLGVRGVAIAGVLGNYTMALSTLGVILGAKLHEDTWGGWTRECLFEWGHYCKLAFSGLIMLVTTWGSYQVGAFLVGIIGNTDLSAFGVTFQVLSLAASWPMGLSVAASVRVGIFLGQGKPEQAKFSASLCVHLTWLTALMTGILFISTRNLIGLAFTSSQSVIELTSKSFLIYFGLIIIFDWLQTVFQGVVRGCGNQKAGALVSVISFFIAVPIGLSLTFLTSLGSLGYWFGLFIAAIFQAVAYYYLMYQTNWSDQSFHARRRSGVAFDECRTLLQKEIIRRRSGVILSDENRPLLQRQREIIQTSFSSSISTEVPNSSVYSSFSISEKIPSSSIEESVNTPPKSPLPRHSSSSYPVSASVGSFQNLLVDVTAPVYVSWKIIISRIVLVLISLLLFIVGLACRLLSE